MSHKKPILLGVVKVPTGYTYLELEKYESTYFDSLKDSDLTKRESGSQISKGTILIPLEFL